MIYIIVQQPPLHSTGPTAIMALMIQPFVKISPDYAVLCAFFSGIVIFLFGVLNLGGPTRIFCVC